MEPYNFFSSPCPHQWLCATLQTANNVVMKYTCNNGVRKGRFAVKRGSGGAAGVSVALDHQHSRHNQEIYKPEGSVFESRAPVRVTGDELPAFQLKLSC